MVSINLFNLINACDVEKLLGEDLFCCTEKEINLGIFLKKKPKGWNDKISWTYKCNNFAIKKSKPFLQES